MKSFRQTVSRSTHILAVIAFALASCACQAADVAHPLRVVTTFSVLADITRQVGGDAVMVESLVGADADVHVFEPSPAAVRRVAAADLVIVNGLGLEGWLDRLIAASGYRGPVVVATRGITPRLDDGHPDPHAWQDLRNGIVYVDNIRDALAPAAPTRAGDFDVRARAYVEKLRRLDQDIRTRFAAIPREQRRVITSHDAFGYFGAAYGIDLIAPRGWSTESEPTPAAVAALIRQLKSAQVRAVFIENITDPRLVRQIAREGGGVIGGTLYSDALSPPGTPADTYVRMFEHNAQTLLDALRR